MNKCSELLKSCLVNVGPVHWRTMERYKLRVIITEQDIQKVSLDGKPDTLEELKTKIKENCKLQYDFSIMYEDPDFDNALCNLDVIEDLPATRATVKVIPLMVTSATTSTSDASCASGDTSIVSPCCSTSSMRQEPWPDFFNIPNFSADVEFRLRQANLRYIRDRTHWIPPKDMKHSILEKLAETIHKFDTDPNVQRFQSVAVALISKHPCLTEPGSPDGCSTWRHSLKFKMRNYCDKLKRAGCTNVASNAEKGGGPQMASKGLKRPQRSEVNCLPDIPEGQSEDSLEAERKLLVEEMKKQNPSGAVIASKMDQTFPLRRREIVQAEPPVKTLKERWPALFTERQVFAEFNRVVTKNLQVEFFEALDRHAPRLVEIFKAKKGSVGQTLTELMQQLDTEKPDVTAMRTIVLRGLPILLGDDPSDFYSSCLVGDTDETWARVPVGVLTVVSEDAQLTPNQLPFDPVSIAIIVEGSIVMDGLQNLPEAFCLLFGLSYALHLEYPKDMKSTFGFIQRVMLGLGENKLPPKLQSLKNLLLS